MYVKQLSVFVENKFGRISEIISALAENSIDISALSLADTSEFGILRLIVDKPELAVDVLKEEGVIVKLSDVLAIAIDDAPGGFAKGLKALTDNGIEIKYMYACISHEKGKALMILSVDDPEKADALIAATDAGKVNPSEIYRHI